MRYLKKGTNIGKIEKKGNSRIKISVKWGNRGMHKEKNQGMKKFSCQKGYIQLNSCNSNSYNSNNHVNRTNSSVPSDFTSKSQTPIIRNSCNSNKF